MPLRAECVRRWVRRHLVGVGAGGSSTERFRELAPSPEQRTLKPEGQLKTTTTYMEKITSAAEGLCVVWDKKNRARTEERVAIRRWSSRTYGGKPPPLREAILTNWGTWIKARGIAKEILGGMLRGFTQPWPKGEIVGFSRWPSSANIT